MEVGKNSQYEFTRSGIKTELIRRVQHFFNSPDNLATQRYIRIEIPITDLNLLAWLNQNQFNMKSYWCDRKADYESAGLDQADYVSGQTLDGYDGLFNEINSRLKAGSDGLHYFGGIGFNPAKYIDEDWHLFGGYYFIIPRFEVIRKGKKLKFAFNHLISKNNKKEQLDKVIEEIEQLSFEVDNLSGSTPSLIRRLNIPEEREWNIIVRAALNNIENGEFEKIVLARKTKLEFVSPLSAFEILNKLKIINPESIHFCFQVDTRHAFLGSSPELLFAREGRKIYSEAIAGTRPRGINEKQDEILENELLSSQKDLREHRFVMNGVRGSLSQLCSQLELSDVVSVLKLARVQHLFASYQGRLKERISDAHIVSRLHPTPAVGGYPNDTSLQKIEDLEPFQRGWYASPIGWIDRTSTKFTVAIRSGLINENILYLFAGSGIVTGSQPKSEWEEIENKIYNFIKVLNINGHAAVQDLPVTLKEKY